MKPLRGIGVRWMIRFSIDMYSRESKIDAVKFTGISANQIVALTGLTLGEIEGL